MALTKVNSILVDGAINTDASGNVGIGTSTPAAKLQVSVGTTNISGSAWNNSNFVVGGSTSTSGGFGVSYNDTTGTIIASLLPSSAWKDLTTYSNQTIFCSGGVNERMRIDSSGRVFASTTNTAPSINNVYGVALNSDGNGNYAAGVCQFSANGSSAILLNRGSDDGTTMAFRRTGTQVGAINVTTGGTSYVTSSDYRLKENIAPMTGALAKVALLKPCTYTWKETGYSGQGFIAHELAEICPDAVSGEKDAVDAEGNIDPQGIDTSFLVATLTAAIQELNAKVDAQALEIATLKAAK
jgi:hypothetical protein